MKSFLIKIAIGIGLGFLGFNLIELGGNSTSAEEIQKYEGLCKNNMETLGYYDSTYTVLKVSRAKVSTIKFKYAVNGTFYDGEQTLGGAEGPTTSMAHIWYDSQNPASYSLEEPCAQLAAHQKKYHLPSTVLFISGALLLLIAFGMIRSSFINMVRGAIKTARGTK